MEDLLFDKARFWYKHQPEGASEGRWFLLDYTSAKLNGLKCKRGVLELLGQTATICWEDSTGKKFVEKPLIKPVFIQRANASNEYGALQNELSPLNIGALMDIARNGTEFVLLLVRGDMAASSVRMKVSRSWKELLYAISTTLLLASRLSFFG